MYLSFASIQMSRSWKLLAIFEKNILTELSLFLDIILRDRETCNTMARAYANDTIIYTL